MAISATEDGKPYDCILGSYNMAEQNGLEFFKQLRAQEDYKKVLMILTSTTILSPEDQSKATEMSLSLMAKPVHQSNLFDTLVSKFLFTKVEQERRKLSIESNKNETNYTGPALRILVTEDNIVNQQVAKAILTKMGHHVDVAANGYEALEAFRNFSYHLIFMDMQMPDMDGLEATRAIRKLEDNSAHIPIIAMTANAFKESEDQCYAAGMDDYLTKPVNVEKIIKKIEGISSINSNS